MPTLWQQWDPFRAPDAVITLRVFRFQLLIALFGLPHAMHSWIQKVLSKGLNQAGGFVLQILNAELYVKTDEMEELH
ncbi:hypothetical protein BPOR_0149g00190 [Botrytis porri]|uniref:Uncharacterized protein n=1 Tax=Botrytis porri TaxID=87229 RepID=A0A4Z1KVV7_9HELO|nr:hypothetical protein BPOR_0149g00190 [Botrytis porri]